MTRFDLPALDRRSLLIAAAAIPFVRHARAADVERFALGVASGAPRADGVVLWTRLTGPALPERVDVQWEVSKNESFTQIVARGTEVAERDWAHSVHAEPAGLAPGAWYWYRFSSMGARSAPARTRTLPAAGADEPCTFAIASCQRWDQGYYAAWRHMAAENPDVVMFLGDYIYEGGSPSEQPLPRRHDGGRVHNLEQYRARYAQYKTDPDLQRMHAQAPWIFVWDDHEVENDYAGLTSSRPGDKVPFPLLRAAAYKAYWEHMPFPKASRPIDGSMRIYERYDWGRLARIHALDDRQFRDPQACPRVEGRGAATLRGRDACPAMLQPDRTMLGAAQERWLDEGWSTEQRWNLVAQQTLMASKARRGPHPNQDRLWTDGWDGYPMARRRLLESARARRANGVVVLGGDVHTNYVADLKLDFDAPGAPVVATEFCGTSISSRGIDQQVVEKMVRYNPHIHYGHSDERGYIAFRLDRQRLQASLRVLDDVMNPQSGVRTAARFDVDPLRPGVQT